MNVTYIVNGKRVDPNGNPVQDTAPEPKAENLRDLNVDELKDRAKEAGIKGYSTMRRDELIEKLEEA